MKMLAIVLAVAAAIAAIGLMHGGAVLPIARLHGAVGH